MTDNSKKKLTTYLQEYSEINTKIKDLNNNMKKLRETKKNYEDNLIDIFKENNRDIIQYKSVEYNFKKTESFESITQKYLKEQIEDFFKDNEPQKGKELLKCIFNNRHKKQCESIDIKNL